MKHKDLCTLSDTVTVTFGLMGKMGVRPILAIRVVKNETNTPTHYLGNKTPNLYLIKVIKQLCIFARDLQYHFCKRIIKSGIY